jgi:hypothetical protein
LEYQFECSAPEVRVKSVRRQKYYHGHLDWYSSPLTGKPLLRRGGNQPNAGGFRCAHHPLFIPTPIQFDGMPNTRWWTFEEGRTNFGDINPDTTDIDSFLLIEFGLVYANDWYLLPVTLPAGTIVNIQGMSVKNVFGENFWITATGKGRDDDPDRWTMFSLDIAGTDRRPADLGLMVTPSVPKIQEGTPVEEIQLVRDEVANMVWGIEKRIPLPSGESVHGREASRDTLRHLRRIIGQSTPPVEPHRRLPQHYAIKS